MARREPATAVEDRTAGYLNCKWNPLSACNAEHSLLKAPNRRPPAPSAKTNDNLFITAVSSGRRSNDWPPIIITALKTKHRTLWESAPNRSLLSASAHCSCKPPLEICFGIAFHCWTKKQSLK